MGVSFLSPLVSDTRILISLVLFLNVLEKHCTVERNNPSHISFICSDNTSVISITIKEITLEKTDIRIVFQMSSISENEGLRIVSAILV